MQGKKGTLTHGTSGYSAKCRCKICRDAWRIYQKQRQRIRSEPRLKWINAYKMERGCKKCGYREHPKALTFDHRNPATKKFGVTHGLGNRAWKQTLAEVKKCDVLCFNCHMIKTFEQGESNVCRR